MTTNLADHARRVAAAPQLLVASDFDGTLAPIASTPSMAAPDPHAMQELCSLAGMPRTHTAIISGRALADLDALTGTPDHVTLVGSHGAEGLAGPLVLDAAQADLLTRVADALQLVAGRTPGALVEHKPSSVAYHYRNVPEAVAEPSLHDAIHAATSLGRVDIRHGHKVVEFSVIPASKAAALERLRDLTGAASVVFIGDDITDLDAFAVLRPADLAVVVGDLPWNQGLRLRDQAQVAEFLAELAAARAGHLRRTAGVPIEHHALLSDQRTAVLVAPDARIVWMCAPRADGRALFAELLGGPAAGHFSILPAQAHAAAQPAYLGDTLIVQTAWPTLTVTDYLDTSAGRAFQRAGRTDLIRRVEGSGQVIIEFAPRLDYGRVPTTLTALPDGLRLEGAADPVVLHAPGISWELVPDGRHHTARAVLDVPPEGLTLELRYGAGTLQPSRIPEPARRAQTNAHWANWAATLAMPAGAQGLVRRSALTLRALVHGPTGAILAAPTTSLPETLGGVRNWDYRYCWVRDGALTAAALLRLGNQGIAMKFLDWVLAVVDRAGAPDRLRPLYTISGDELGSEGEIGELSGYEESRPVRVGNAAADQLQLDVFGPVVDLVAILAERGAPLSPDHWRLVRAMAEAVESRWREPDHGIWEVRLARRHFVHSKVMCWLTLDRAAFLSREYLGRERPDWAALRDEIRADVLQRGWSPTLGSFAAAYDLDEHDASVLWVGLSGLLPPDDPRFVATVNAIDAALRQGPTVMRYRYDDGLPGLEGGFHICTSWLIESLAILGRREQALELFSAMIACAGPTGLLPEEHCPRTNRGLGNHPQAYSHLGLINAATRLFPA